MPELELNFSGWKAVVVIVIVLLVIGVRFITFKDQKDNKALVKEIELELTTEYFPDDVAKLRAAVDSGDEDEISDVAESITTTKLNIEAVQISRPLFDFSSSKDVIVKVKYSLNDATGTRKAGTNYYRFENGLIVNSWRYKGKSSVVFYYLNFI